VISRRIQVKLELWDTEFCSFLGLPTSVLGKQPLYSLFFFFGLFEIDLAM
jgi:hypothetical protein